MRGVLRCIDSPKGSLVPGWSNSLLLSAEHYTRFPSRTLVEELARFTPRRDAAFRKQAFKLSSHPRAIAKDSREHTTVKMNRGIT